MKTMSNNEWYERKRIGGFVKIEKIESREFIKILHQKYLESGLGVMAFSEILGISAPALCYLFSGKRTSLNFTTAIRAANIFKIDLGAFQKRFSYRNPTPRIRRKYTFREKEKANFNLGGK